MSAQERTLVGPAWIFTHPRNYHSIPGNQRLWEHATLQPPVAREAESQASDHSQQDAVRQSGAKGDVSEIGRWAWRSNPNTDSL